jgi:hypothetical protein
MSCPSTGLTPLHLLPTLLIHSLRVHTYLLKGTQTWASKANGSLQPLSATIFVCG